MTTQVSKSRDYCFTINNPTDDDQQRLTINHDSVQYIIYGIEVGQQGTTHFQGFIQFKHPVTFERCKQITGNNSHIESRKGSVLQAIEYCKKDGQVVEQGTPQRLRNGKEVQQQKWSSIISLAEENKLDHIKQEYPSEYIRYLNTLRSLSKGSKRILDVLDNEWWYGDTGTGKSMKAWRLYPDHYPKELNKWWCGYTDQEVVVIEEWCPKNECTASQLKIWADRYPFTAQIKGGSLQKIRPLKIIVLSNYSIDQCFTNPEDRDPIKRRFKQIHHPFKIDTIPRLPSPLPNSQRGSPRVGQAAMAPQALPSDLANIDLEFLDDFI